MDQPEAGQHLLVPYFLDPDAVEEVVSGRSGGWTGFRRRGIDRARERIRRFWPEGTTFAVLLGGILASAFTPRISWLNLAARPAPRALALAAFAAGLLAGAFHRTSLRRAAQAGTTAAVVALVGVYAAVRASVPVLFVEESFSMRAVADIGRLLLFSVPGGAIGGIAACGLRRRRV